jgi:hypothetical protein
MTVSKNRFRPLTRKPYSIIWRIGPNFSEGAHLKRRFRIRQPFKFQIFSTYPPPKPLNHKIIPPPPPFNQLPPLVEHHPFPFQQLQLLLAIHSARCLLPASLEPPNVPRRRDAAVAGHLGRERVVAEGAPDGARGRGESPCKRPVGRYAAGGNLFEEGVDTLGWVSF